MTSKDRITLNTVNKRTEMVFARNGRSLGYKVIHKTNNGKYFYFTTNKAIEVTSLFKSTGVRGFMIKV